MNETIEHMFLNNLQEISKSKTIKYETKIVYIFKNSQQGGAFLNLRKFNQQL